MSGREHRPRDPRGFYSTGSTTVFASRYDQRFSYCLHVPRQHDPDGEALPLVVAQHGTGRRGPQYRDNFAGFAEEHGCVVLAPLFPAGIDDPDDLHNFKFIRYGDIRFDLVLLAMVDEVGERFNVHTRRFLLHGFSGGGQFAHRFFYLHPDRLAGVSIGAPGRVTLIDHERPWWIGLKDVERIVGAAPKLDQLAEVPVQMVVGGADVETWEINNPGDSNWMDGAQDAGRTRVERLTTLRENFEKHGIRVRFDIVDGVGHEPMSVLESVKDFFAGILSGAGR
ncbi:alpha/beta hydrolase [Saccharopolyspora erythraea]|uniref:alpha/beta hydrolase n=1 Tax=Saccharopolyspora erythraea TaxID=1836 RepID=UPI001BA4481A|nr:alpha/beta hydrolase [Saccharopolyspora erythraea]QUH02006.1 alpha/beta hydrolase [Saccharopolyspora erythraea]